MVTQIELAVTTGSLVASALVIYSLYRIKHKRTEVGVVKKLIIYPVKSCRGIEVEEAQCTPYGLASLDGKLRDRQFMMIDANGALVSSRTHPTMVKISTRLEVDDLVMEAPGMDPLHISLRDVDIGSRSGKLTPCNVHGSKFKGVECDEALSTWFSDFLKCPVKLLYFNPGICSRPLEKYKPGVHNWHVRADKYNKTMFADSFPCMIANDRSCEDLNLKLDSSAQVTYRTFRPNILVTTGQPWIEDSWRHVAVGDQEFFHEKPCARCRMVNVNTETAEVHPKAEPLNTMRKFRMLKDYTGIATPVFGIKVMLDGEPSRIKVGDPVIA